nr:MAG TPA: EB1-like C-terminal motif [Caudoviricetes sp.]
MVLIITRDFYFCKSFLHTYPQNLRIFYKIYKVIHKIIFL